MAAQVVLTYIINFIIHSLINMEMSNVTHEYLILKSLLFILLLQNLKHCM